jgi:hypothetical protein
MTKAPNPFRWSDSSPDVFRLVVMLGPLGFAPFGADE